MIVKEVKSTLNTGTLIVEHMEMAKERKKDNPKKVIVAMVFCLILLGIAYYDYVKELLPSGMIVVGVSMFILCIAGTVFLDIIHTDAVIGACAAEAPWDYDHVTHVLEYMNRCSWSNHTLIDVSLLLHKHTSGNVMGAVICDDGICRVVTYDADGNEVYATGPISLKGPSHDNVTLYVDNKTAYLKYNVPYVPDDNAPVAAGV